MSEQRPFSEKTPITVGLVILVLSVSAGAIFKAGQVLSDLDYVKLRIAELASDVSEVKRVVYRIDRQPRDTAGK